jgi:hypothetical protein
VDQWMKRAVQHRPRLLSGSWFAVAAALLATPLVLMALLVMGAAVVTGEPFIPYLAFLLAIFVLPVGLAFGSGSLTGPLILKLPRHQAWRAGAIGAATALGSTILWAALLEGLPRLIRRPLPGFGGSGDVPGAAEALGYICFLPALVVLPALVGAFAGVLLHAMTGERTERPAGGSDSG